MFYVNNCKNDALLVRILVVFSIFDSRNPRGTYFPEAPLQSTNAPLYYLVHENPYQRSCWGTIPVRIESNLIKCFLSFSQFN